jgi:hypothetical protein
MGLCIFCSQVVAVIACNQRNAGFFTEVDEIPVDDFLFRHPCGLKFQEEIILAEDVAILHCSLLGPGITGGQQMGCHLSM